MNEYRTERLRLIMSGGLQYYDLLMSLLSVKRNDLIFQILN